MVYLKKRKIDLQFFAHKKGGGSASTNCHHDSISKRRGVKKFSGENIKRGGIIVRQLGSKFLAGKNTFISRDYTIHAGKDGVVGFQHKKIKHRSRTLVIVN